MNQYTLHCNSAIPPQSSPPLSGGLLRPPPSDSVSTAPLPSAAAGHPPFPPSEQDLRLPFSPDTSAAVEGVVRFRTRWPKRGDSPSFFAPGPAYHFLGFSCHQFLRLFRLQAKPSQRLVCDAFFPKDANRRPPFFFPLPPTARLNH